MRVRGANVSKDEGTSSVFRLAHPAFTESSFETGLEALLRMRMGGKP
jgi:hypothetical protein